MGMAKPRLHEVMSEYDVPAKTAIRVLRDMGEFVKGPSSSVDPAVARRLREELERQGHQLRVPYFRRLTSQQSSHAATLLGHVPRALPELVELLATHREVTGLSDAEELLRVAFEQADLYFMPARGRNELAGRESQVLSLRSDDLPSPVGIALIPAHDADGEPQWGLLTWFERPSDLEVSWLPIARRESGSSGQLALVRGRQAHDRVPFADDIFVHRSGELGVLCTRLAALLDCVPERGEAGAPSGATDRAGPDTAPDDDGGVALVYPSRGAGARRWATGATRSFRWKVRGHWRQHWYRSEQVHRRIWIDEHEAGAQDAPVQVRQRVAVISPREPATGS
ncbi:hypothetical protein ASG05_01940 [Frigoribacterium sp. Leaf186]|nr:hypothetical protein ASG05_01940 [Frigoribacterium sp. Leaf186]